MTAPAVRKISPDRQLGVALITALLVVALVAIIATSLNWNAYLDLRRTANLLAMDAALLYALGAESWAADVLADDLKTGDPDDHFGEEWATPLPPLPVDGGVIQGALEDMQGRFNINSLVTGRGERDVLAVERFERLLDSLGIDTRFASLTADWIDIDVEPGFPEGAEDGIYTGFNPPYKPPNGPIASTSELLALPEFTIDQLDILKPYITALPLGTSLNVCTARTEVIRAMDEDLNGWSPDDEDLADERTTGCTPTLAELATYVDPERFQELPLGQSSVYFRATTRVSIGTAELTMYSLLERDSQGGQVRTIIRSLGSE